TIGITYIAVAVSLKPSADLLATEQARLFFPSAWNRSEDVKSIRNWSSLLTFSNHLSFGLRLADPHTVSRRILDSDPFTVLIEDHFNVARLPRSIEVRKRCQRLEVLCHRVHYLHSTHAMVAIYESQFAFNRPSLWNMQPRSSWQNAAKMIKSSSQFDLAQSAFEATYREMC